MSLDEITVDSIGIFLYVSIIHESLFSGTFVGVEDILIGLYFFKYLYPSNSGIWMFKGVSVSYSEEGELVTKECSIQESFSELYNQIIESVKEVISSGSSGTEESIV